MLDNDKFGQEVLTKIKDEKLAPKARWRFLLKDYVVWGAGLFSLLLGGLSTSLIIYMIRSDEWQSFDRAGGAFWEKIFLIVPLFWVICLGLFAWLFFYNIKHTKKGYRFGIRTMLVVIILASIGLGAVFYSAGLGEQIDDVLGQHAPFYDRIINPRINFWSKPQFGRLSGIIISQRADEEYMLMDRDRIEWIVMTSGSRQAPNFTLVAGRPAHFYGQVLTDHRFKAIEVLPIMPGKRFFNRMGVVPPLPPLDTIARVPGAMCGLQATTLPIDSLSLLFDKYPDLRSLITKNILADKTKLNQLVATDPQIMKLLIILQIDTSTLNRTK